MFLAYTQIAFATWVSKKSMSYLSVAGLERVLFVEPMALIYKNSVGHYSAIAGDEAARVGQIFFNAIQFISSLLAACIGLLMIWAFDYKIFLFALIFIITSAIIVSFFFRRMLVLSNEMTELSRKANTTFIESFNGIRSIRSMGGEKYIANQYRQQQNRYGYLLFILDLINQSSKVVPGLILILFALIIFYPTSNNSEEISAIYFFTVATMLIRVLAFLGGAVSHGGRVAIDIRASYDLDEVIGKSFKNENVDIDKKIITSIDSITISHLSCGYIVNKPILCNVSIKMKRGNSYALIGRSGSGKSTLSDILLGLLEPMSGKLEISGLSYDAIDLESLRRKVVLVEQQSRIFSGSLRENIAFGLSPTEDQMMAAIEASGLREFIDKLPLGLESQLDYQGANFSGGQRQRIGLARAILRMPDVLILDEATSALDEYTKDIVLQRLKEIFNNKILLFITHDSHVIKIVDEVWEIANNKILVGGADIINYDL
jgi:ATP-binding cassette subfamily B protein